MTNFGRHLDCKACHCGKDLIEVRPARPKDPFERALIYNANLHITIRAYLDFK